jgi:hypothetical protein
LGGADGVRDVEKGSDMSERDPNQLPADSGRAESSTTPPAWRPAPADAPAPPPDAARHEETSESARTVTVSRPRGGGATRWGIALVVVALVVGVAAAAAFLIAGQSTPSTLLAYAPKTSVTWAEARLDLPGDQRQKVGDFLAKFPGFADQSTLEAKLDEALDRIVKSATRDQQDYSTKIKPWFGGEVGIAIPSFPDASSITTGTAATKASALAMVSVSDAAKARAWFDDTIKDAPHSTTTYNGVDMVVIGDTEKGVMAIVDGKVMLLGDEASVKTAIDSKGQGGLATSDSFKAASAAMTGDALLTYYMDGKAYADWATRSAQQSGANAAMAGYFAAVLHDRLPAWIAGRVRSEGDALRVEQVNPHVDAGPKRENRASNVLDNLPGSTIVAMDIHELGATAKDVVDMFRKAPGSEDAFKQVDQVVALVGGWDALINWIGDADIVVARDGTKVGGGLVVAPTDRAAADRLVSTLKGFLALGGSQAGVSLSEEDYNGTKIAVVSMQGAATPVPGATVPKIGIAVTDQVVVIGADLDFVKSVLDTKSGSSLADDARFKGLLDRVGTKNYSSVWFDVRAIREVVEQLGKQQDPTALSQYEKDVKPYILPFDAVIGSAVVDGGFDRANILLTVKQP